MGLLFDGYGVSDLRDASVVGRDGCYSTVADLMPLGSTLKMIKMAKVMLCGFYHSKNVKALSRFGSVHRALVCRRKGP